MRIHVTAAMAAALLLANSAASASEWAQVGQNTAGSTFQVDTSSIHIEGSIRRAWSKMTPAPHTMRGSGDDAKKFVSYGLNRISFNCSDESMRNDSVVFYYEDGSVRTAPAEILRKTFEPVPPDTSLSYAMQFVCAWKPK